jgi:photosystem II stability/assembly factor-like uncharacterized protein
MLRRTALTAALAICSFVGTLSAADTWTRLNSGTTGTLHGLWFTSANVGYACGDSGMILKTIDAGDHWSRLASATTLFLYCIHFPTADTGYASANWGTGNIVRTFNAGQTWDTVHSGSITYSTIRFCNGHTGYAAGNGETIIKTTNAGTTWTLKPREGVMVGNFENMFCIDTSTVLIAGGDGYIFKTVNSGTDWTHSSVANWISAIFFTSRSTGYIAGNYSCIYRTQDSGATWTKLHGGGPTDNDWYTSAWFTDNATGYVCGGPKVLRTLDAGLTWDSMATGVTGVALYALCFTSAQVGYVVGTQGTILKLVRDPVSAAQPGPGRRTSVSADRTVGAPAQALFTLNGQWVGRLPAARGARAGLYFVARGDGSAQPVKRVLTSR